MKQNRIKSRIEEFCEMLEMPIPPLFDKHTLIDPGPKTKDSIRSNVYRMFNEGRLDFSLGQMTDLTRCTAILEDYHEMPKYIGRLKKIDPALRGTVKRNQSSGYVGIHLQTENDGIPSEIQLQTPFGFQVKKIADVNYDKTRLFASLAQRFKTSTLGSSEMKELEWRKQDFQQRSQMERELFSLLSEYTDIDQNLIRVEQLLAEIEPSDKSKKIFPVTYPYDAALAQPLNGRQPNVVSSQKLTKAINIVSPYLPQAQSHLCGEAISPLQSGRTIKYNASTEK